MPPLTKERLREATALLAATVVPVCIALAWRAADRSPPHDDDLTLFRMAACLYDKLPAPSAPMACSTLGPYPPLVPLVAALAFFVNGEADIHLAVTSLVVSYAVLAGALYVGTRAEAGRLPAIAAGWLGVTLWLAAGCRTSFYTESWMAALAATSLAALAWSRGLRRPIPSAGLGIALGLGMLAKWTFAFLLAPPVALAVLLAGPALSRRPLPGIVVTAAIVGGAGAAGAALLGIGPASIAAPLAAVLLGGAAVGGALLARGPRGWRHPETSGRLASLALAVGLPALIAGPWYIAASGALSGFLESNVDHRYAGDAMTLAETWPFYPATALRDLGPFLLAIAALGAIRALLPGGPVPVRRRFAAWCLLAVVSAAMLLSVSPYRASRYVSPAYPLLVPAMFAAMPRIAPRWTAALLGAFALLAQLSWLLPLDPRRFPALNPMASTTAHLAGNTRDGMAASRALLRDPPLTLPVVIGVPLGSAPDIAAMVDAVELPATGALSVVIVEHRSLSMPAVEAELIRRHAAGRMRVVSTPNQGDPTGPAAAARQSRSEWVLEVTDYQQSDGRAPDWVTAREQALRDLGLVVRWEERLDRHNVRVERVWGPSP